MSQFMEVTSTLLSGFGVTLKLFALTLLFALPLGFVISFGSMSRHKWLSAVTKVFVWIIRGTPLMLQILVVFFVPGLIFKNPIFAKNRFLAALITFVINYSCYFSEIFRSGIQSIPKGQSEAGAVLGMTRAQIFFKILLRQVIKNVLPPICNEVLTLVKDTSLVRVITVVEIIKNAEKWASKGLIWPLFYTGVFYLAFCGLMTLLFQFFERKLEYMSVRPSAKERRRARG